MFRKILLTTATLGVLGTAAHAADLADSVPAPAPHPVAFSWTGFYAGAQIGYGFGDGRVRQFNLGGLSIGNGRLNTDGVLGGIHLGYNYQVNNWVFGLETDFEGSDLGSSNRLLGSGDLARQSVNWQGSVRGRLGYAFDRLLVYGTGGLAYGELENRFTNGITGISQSFTDTRVGWTAGAGFEYAFLPNWTARLEYRYTELDRGTFAPTVGTSVAGSTFRDSPNFHAVRAAISYKF